MYVNRARLRELRTARQWSQEQLATLSGLNLRTIQRLESGTKISKESLQALAAVFEVPAESLLQRDTKPSESALLAMRDGATRSLEFTGNTSRIDFWWFALGVLEINGIGYATKPFSRDAAVAEIIFSGVSSMDCGTYSRLCDAGLNPWWQLMSSCLGG